MTKKKDLKRRVRERQQRTGESYVAARHAVLGEAEPVARKPSSAIDVVEMDDHTALAAALGFRCKVSIDRRLSAQVEPRAALERLRDVVLATTADPSLEAIRAVALRNERPPRPRIAPDWFEEMRHFVGRVRAGIGGVSEGGTMLALHVDGRRGAVMMICQLGYGIVRQTSEVTLTSVETAGFYIEPPAVRALQR